MAGGADPHRRNRHLTTKEETIDNRDAQREAFRLKNERRKATRDQETREANRAKGELLGLGLYNPYRFEAQQKAKKQAQAEKKARQEAHRGRPGRVPNKPHRM